MESPHNRPSGLMTPTARFRSSGRLCVSTNSHSNFFYLPVADETAVWWMRLRDMPCRGMGPR